jgi:hypothetical protein
MLHINARLSRVRIGAGCGSGKNQQRGEAQDWDRHPA